MDLFNRINEKVLGYPGHEMIENERKSHFTRHNRTIEDDFKNNHMGQLFICRKIFSPAHYMGARYSDTFTSRVEHGNMA